MSAPDFPGGKLPLTRRANRPVDDWPAAPQAPGANLPLDNAGWRTLWPRILAHCNGCGLCDLYCPDAAIACPRGEIPRVLERWCKGCGICARECPQKAIIMVDEHSRSEDPR
ncbi:4Fe-4S binding protein [Ectothiorhodospira lacustris]|uniref:4Fe-4S binding protein n=1 Tax=Ectothiorhodospira lacustris TaxID=2899127 RepID=UPI003D31D239